MSVPNSLARGVFDTLNAPGVELPPGSKGGAFNAHCSVMRPEEIAQIPGGADAITERGHEMTYTLGPLRTVTPQGWTEMSKVWFLTVQSPDLEALRKSYGLSARPKNNEFDFHISVAVRRKSVLRENEVSKVFEGSERGHTMPYKAASWIHYPSQLREKEAAMGYVIGESPIHGKGAFANRPFAAGDVVGDGLRQDKAKPNKFKRSELTSFVNHHPQANTDLRKEGEHVQIVANRAIPANEELTLNYDDAYKLLGDDVEFENGMGRASDAHLLGKTPEKTAETMLPRLQQAKLHSDRGQYAAKAAIMRHLMAQMPQEFLVDQPNQRYAGITHVPTGFQLHVPREIIPQGVLHPELETALTQTPLQYDPAQGVLNNVSNNLGAVQQRAGRNRMEAESVARLRAAIQEQH
jgi:hypothetical protein